MRKVIGRLAGLVGGVVIAGSAQAILFQGNFDPPYYQGTATIDVPTNCVNNNPGQHFVTPDVDCDPVDFVSATVIHDNDPANAIHFDHPQADVVRTLRWVDGVLYGIDTDPVQSGFDPIGPQTSIDGSFWHTSPNLPDYYLQFFTGGEAAVAALTVSAASLDVNPGTVQLFSCPDGFNTCDPVDPDGGPAIQSPFVPVSVPEPGSLALLGAAVAGALSMRRRRRD